jgi:hypothetical protein
MCTYVMHIVLSAVTFLLFTWSDGPTFPLQKHIYQRKLNRTPAEKSGGRIWLQLDHTTGGGGEIKEMNTSGSGRERSTAVGCMLVFPTDNEDSDGCLQNYYLITC